MAASEVPRNSFFNLTMKPTLSIGLYGGMFDPIHNGHLNLAFEIMEKCALDEIWFIPVGHPPLKQDPLVSNEHRLKMASLAVEGIGPFSSLTVECERPGPSYTIDTVKFLIQKYPNISFYLILGEDTILQFDRWMSYEELSALIPFFIGCRSQIQLKEKLDNLSFSPFVRKRIQQGLVETTLMDISSTRVRERLKKKLYCGHLIPSKVLDYIYHYQLYC